MWLVLVQFQEYWLLNHKCPKTLYQTKYDFSLKLCQNKKDQTFVWMLIFLQQASDYNFEIDMPKKSVEHPTNVGT